MRSIASRSASPALWRLICSSTRRAAPSGWVTLAIWGVTITRGWRSKGCSGDGGSCARTSRNRAVDLPWLQRTEKISLDKVAAATNIEKPGAAGEGSQGRGVKDAAGRLRQREKANEDCATSEEGAKLLHPREAVHSGDGLP